MLGSGARRGVLGRLEALRDPITGAALHRGALRGWGRAHLLLFCSGCFITGCGWRDLQGKCWCDIIIAACEEPTRT